MNLAYKMRPQNLDEFAGQDHLVGEGKIIRKMIENDNVSSTIFWGPPGSGKTSLAYIISKETHSNFYALTAVSTGKEDLRKVIQSAKEDKKQEKIQFFS